MQFLDVDLARQLEMSVAETRKQCVISMQSRLPQSNSAYEEIAGGIAAFTGVRSPLTQAIGVGLSGPVSPDAFARLESFFFTRRAPVVLALSPYTDITVLELLREQPYCLAGFTNMLIRDMSPEPNTSVPDGSFEIRPAASNEAKLFIDTVAKGFAEDVPITQQLLDSVECFFHTPNSSAMLAFVDGAPAGGATAVAYDGVGGLFGASTLSQFRGRGVQTALVHARMQWLRERGCGIAMTITNPGTASQRNMERLGFRCAYSRMTFVRRKPWREREARAAAPPSPAS